MEIHSPSRHSFRHRTQGSVLIIVMWVSLGLVSVTLYFAHSMYFEFKAAGNVYEGHQAQQAIAARQRLLHTALLPRRARDQTPQCTLPPPF